MPWVRSPPPACSVDDAVPDVRHRGGLHDSRHLERRSLAAEPVEESDAVAEEEWSDVDLDLVHEPFPQVLLGDVCSAGDLDVPVARSRTRLRERCLDPLRDEGVRRSFLLLHGLAGVVGEDEHGYAEGRVVSPPSVSVRVVLPWAYPTAEHPPAHDDRAGRGERFLDDVVVGVRLATGPAVALTPRGEAVDPLVEPLAALAERLLDRLVRPGDEAVERHRDVQRQLAHGSSLSGVRPRW